MLMLSYGYAVLMGATMPIIGEGNQEPNDNFVKQLVASAQAAADIMVEKKALIGRGKLVHSYPHSWRSKAPLIFRTTPQLSLIHI